MYIQLYERSIFLVEKLFFGKDLIRTRYSKVTLIVQKANDIRLQKIALFFCGQDGFGSSFAWVVRFVYFRRMSGFVPRELRLRFGHPSFLMQFSLRFPNIYLDFGIAWGKSHEFYESRKKRLLTNEQRLRYVILLILQRSTRDTNKTSGKLRLIHFILKFLDFFKNLNYYLIFRQILNIFNPDRKAI